jgi:hypothetical protein
MVAMLYIIRYAAMADAVARAQLTSLNSGQLEASISGLKASILAFTSEIYQNNPYSYINEHYTAYTHKKTHALSSPYLNWP